MLILAYPVPVTHGIQVDSPKSSAPSDASPQEIAHRRASHGAAAISSPTAGLGVSATTLAEDAVVWSLVSLMCCDLLHLHAAYCGRDDGVKAAWSPLLSLPVYMSAQVTRYLPYLDSFEQNSLSSMQIVERFEEV
jgi:hypothetical protein